MRATPNAIRFASTAGPRPQFFFSANARPRDFRE
jgi:hypothetical protein